MQSSKDRITFTIGEPDWNFHNPAIKKFCLKYLPADLHAYLSPQYAEKHFLDVLILPALPYGFALAIYNRAFHFAEIIYLFVRARSRKKGYGTLLWQAAEQALTKRSTKVITALFEDQGKKKSAAFREILEKAAWSEPKLFMLRCTCDRNIIPPWLDYTCKLPSGCEIVLWGEASSEARDRLAYDIEQWGVPNNLSPFKETFPIEPRTSLVLLCEGQILGWIIAHRMAEGVTRLSTFYIRRDLRMTGAGMQLAIEALNRTLAIPEEKESYFEIVIEKIDPRLFKLLTKHFIPYLASVRRWMKSWKAP